MMRARRALAVLAVITTVVAMTAVSMAAWLASTAPGASAASAALQMPVGERPTATVDPPNSTAVTLSWPPSTGGAPVEGYEVRAYDASTGAPRSVGGDCAGIVRATTCTEAGAPSGGWTYAVVPRQQAWAGQESPRSSPVTVDPDPPTVNVTFPASGGAYTNATWSAGCSSRICGTASDALSGVTSVAVSIRRGTGSYWNGTSFASSTEVLLPASGTTDWTLSFGAAGFPAGGTYTVRAVATDGAGNSTAASSTFTINRIGPTVAVTFPANGSAHTNATWTAGCSTATIGDICGTASVPSGSIASVSVSIRQGTGNYWNGSAFASQTEVLLPATGTTSWSRSFAASNLPADGTYTVRAVATDSAGTTSAASSTFTVDRTAPSVPITFPVNGNAYNTSGWNAGCSTPDGDVCGAASDAGSGVASVAVSIRQGTGSYWNGTSFASATEVLLPASGTTEWTRAFAASNFPTEGSYTVRAVATDRAGNIGSASATLVGDGTAPPGAAYTFPASNASYTSASWTQGCSTPTTGDACGTATDALSGVASVAVSVRQGTSGPYWDGASFASAAEVFVPATGTAAWNLPFPASRFPVDGQYTMRVRVVDRAGNVSTSVTQRSFSITRFAPSALALTDANGIVDPTVDELNLTFNQAPNVSSICSAWSGTGNQSLSSATGGGVVVTITDNGSNDIVTVTSTACDLRIGSFQTGRNYVTSTATLSGSTASSASRVTWTASSRVLNIHLGALTSGSRNPATQAAATVTYTPDPRITDVAGNPIVPAPFAVASRRF